MNNLTDKQKETVSEITNILGLSADSVKFDGETVLDQLKPKGVVRVMGFVSSVDIKLLIERFDRCYLSNKGGLVIG